MTNISQIDQNSVKCVNLQTYWPTLVCMYAAIKINDIPSYITCDLNNKIIFLIIECFNSISGLEEWLKYFIIELQGLAEKFIG